MHQPTESELITALMARCDAMTWITGTLIQSHTRLSLVASKWHARRMLANSGSLEGQPMTYKQAYADELIAWTNVVDELDKREKDD